MTRSRLTAVTAACLASVALVAGCSSTDDKNEYVDEVNAIQEDALTAVEAATNTTADNKEQFSKQLDSAATALDEAVVSLNEVDVPEDAQAGHDEFIAGIEAMRDLFVETQEKAKKAEGAELITIVTDLQVEGTELSAQIDAAITKINDDIGAS